MKEKNNGLILKELSDALLNDISLVQNDLHIDKIDKTICLVSPMSLIDSFIAANLLCFSYNKNNKKSAIFFQDTGIFDWQNKLEDINKTYLAEEHITYVKLDYCDLFILDKKHYLSEFYETFNFEHFVNEKIKCYDHVIFCPQPALVTNDFVLFKKISYSFLVVVKKNNTKRYEIYKMLDLLKNKGIEADGIVFLK